MISSMGRLPHRLVRWLWRGVILHPVKVILRTVFHLCPTKEDVLKVAAFLLFLILMFLLIGIYLGSQDQDMTKIDLSKERQEYLIKKYKEELVEEEKLQFKGQGRSRSDMNLNDESRKKMGRGEEVERVEPRSRLVANLNKKKVADSSLWDGDIGNGEEIKQDQKKDVKELDRDKFLDNLEDYNKEESDDLDPDDPKLHKEILADALHQRLQSNREKTLRLNPKNPGALKPRLKQNELKSNTNIVDPKSLKYCILYDMKETIKEDYECVFLQFSVSNVPVCLYPDREDIHISAHIRDEGIWEPHLLNQFRDFLATDPELGFIDIGANIGLYSLIAAKLGHQVAAVEPFLDNIKHFHKAVQIAGLHDKIWIIQNAISDRRGSISLITREDNQGGAALDIPQENQEPGSCSGPNCPKVQVILMDDLLEVITFKKAIIKIDIEGHEHRAFRNSSMLLSKIHVPFIFMEWIKLRGYYGADITDTEDKTLTKQLVQYLTSKGYVAFSSVTGKQLDPVFWFAWGDDIIWKLNI